MAKRPLVHCRRCTLAIDRDNQNDWIMATKNYYYHISCYEDFVNDKKKAKSNNGIDMVANDDLWKSAVNDYLTKDLKISINYPKFNSQWDNFLKKKMTAKGIYFTLRYFYEIEKGDVTKAEGAIGIVPHIYDRATCYWGERNQRDKGICARIEEQILASAHAPTKVIIQQRKKVQKPVVDLSAIADMEDEE